MKRPMILLISTAFILTSLAGCMAGPKVTEDTSEAVTVVTSETTTVPSATTETTTEATTTEDPRGHFEFRPVVIPRIMGDYMGEDVCEAYNNYINAVMNGEDDFEVKDAETYDWMIGQLPSLCFPVVGEYTESFYADAYNNGRGKFQYKIPKEELKVKEAEFEKLVTDILNENLRDDYSDFEKVFALYLYFSRTYTYDYDVYQSMADTYQDNLSAYRFLTTGHGICSECAPAFAYLLLQAGVDATFTGGMCPTTNEGHSWVYVTINGKDYHIDPTYAMSSPDYLSYLMMTDEQRENEDGYQKQDMDFARSPKGEYKGEDLKADDDYFAPLWGGYLQGWYPEKDIIYYTDANGNDATFDYSSYEN